MNAAIYIRVSTERQASAGHVSLAVQRERCVKFCADKGWRVAAIETDHESGLKTTRVGYQKVLELARSGAIEHVVVYAASRFGRKAWEVLARIEELRDDHGVQLHSTSEDLSSFVLTGMTAVINEERSREISRLSSPAKLHRARDGYWLAHAPFGTINNHGVLEAGAEIDILRGMFERAAAGVSVRQITLWANSLRDQPLTREGVREMLRSDAYLGKTRWAGQTFDGRWEPFVDPDLWKRAQHVVRQRRNIRAEIDAERPHWILGLAYCGRCGHKMSRRIATKTWGTRYEYLACNRRDKGRIEVGCGSPHLPIRKVQAQVLEELRGMVMRPAQLEAFCAELEAASSRAGDELSADRKVLVAERARLVTRQQKARQAYFDDVYDKAEYHRATNGIRDAITAIDERLSDEPVAPAIAIGLVRQFFGDVAWLATADESPLQFRELLRVFIERVDVGPLAIVWRVPIPAAHTV